MIAPLHKGNYGWISYKEGILITGPIYIALKRTQGHFTAILYYITVVDILQIRSHGIIQHRHANNLEEEHHLAIYGLPIVTQYSAQGITQCLLVWQG